jgi:hypothetical protein
MHQRRVARDCWLPMWITISWILGGIEMKLVTIIVMDFAIA